ncbi:hypothetical protein SCOR_04710 [Sulfidibacter corallicola]|uniref:Uncharacterized protein n=1 Tax=Sulfidibacter corallicola TaxID=2818388 RepID=A0A8A4TZI8_SULCO|nr:hypothetical protein [Sulfidibacter corallicola]QTD51925.1 hypothetical protein J3U87_05585 [Sulfidibacter corallicola]
MMGFSYFDVAILIGLVVAGVAFVWGTSPRSSGFGKSESKAPTTYAHWSLLELTAKAFGMSPDNRDLWSRAASDYRLELDLVAREMRMYAPKPFPYGLELSETRGSQTENPKTGDAAFDETIHFDLDEPASVTILNERVRTLCRELKSVHLHSNQIIVSYRFDEAVHSSESALNWMKDQFGRMTDLANDLLRSTTLIQRHLEVAAKDSCRAMRAKSLAFLWKQPDARPKRFEVAGSPSDAELARLCSWFPNLDREWLRCLPREAEKSPENEVMRRILGWAHQASEPQGNLPPIHPEAVLWMCGQMGGGSHASQAWLIRHVDAQLVPDLFLLLRALPHDRADDLILEGLATHGVPFLGLVRSKMDASLLPRLIDVLDTTADARLRPKLFQLLLDFDGTHAPEICRKALEAGDTDLIPLALKGMKTLGTLSDVIHLAALRDNGYKPRHEIDQAIHAIQARENAGEPGWLTILEDDREKGALSLTDDSV